MEFELNALVKHPEKSLLSLLVTINGLFSKLEASIGHFHTVCQVTSLTKDLLFFPLAFPVRDAINLIYENLHKLDSYLNVIVRV